MRWWRTCVCIHVYVEGSSVESSRLEVAFSQTRGLAELALAFLSYYVVVPAPKKLHPSLSIMAKRRSPDSVICIDLTEDDGERQKKLQDVQKWLKRALLPR
jgi:hypothetical protein